MNIALRLSRLSRHARFLATASGSVPPKSEFSETLSSGPTLDDFIVGNVPDRVVLGSSKGYAAQ
jgi:lipoic acid synthetase